jgi:hypothetical protein
MISEMSLIQGCNTPVVSFNPFTNLLVDMLLRHLSNNLFIAVDDSELKKNDQSEQRDYDFALHGFTFVFRSIWSIPTL